MIDTHSHLYAEEFDEDTCEVIKRCKASGLTHVLLPNIEKSTHHRMMNLVTTDTMFLPMIGLHPCSVQAASVEEELQFVQDELEVGGYIAVGEIGMDLYWDASTREVQEYALKKQCELAVRHDLPVALHTRNATDVVLDLLESWNLNGLRGVFHCFGDGTAQAERIKNMGFYLGIGGVITFKNSGLDQVMAEIGLDQVILETDSPYLAPVPYRGKRNESSYLIHIAQKLSDATGVNLEEVKRITSNHAKELFRID
ncbi:MAG: TatD family hydrolase [Bacteroidetes bacterium]|nr:TatD family hydrolase [Bacteroidota bacterium]